MWTFNSVEMQDIPLQKGVKRFRYNELIYIHDENTWLHLFQNSKPRSNAGLRNNTYNDRTVRKSLKWSNSAQRIGLKTCKT